METNEFKKLEKTLESLKEMMEIKIQQHSGHQSDVLSQLKTVTDNISNISTDLTAFKLKVDPMLRAFNETENYKMVWTKTGITIRKTSTWIIVVGGALGILWAGLKFGFRFLK